MERTPILSFSRRLLLTLIVLQYLISESFSLEVSILTQNVWFILIASIPANDRAPLIAEYLKTSTYDIVCLQEVWSSGVDTTYLDILLPELSEAYPYTVEYQPQPLVSGSVLDSGLVLLSKHPVKSSSFHAYGNKTGLDGLASKGAMVAHIEVLQDGMAANLIVLNTHLQAGGPDEIRYNQTLEAVHTLDLFVESLVNDGAIDSDEISQTPIIAVGDFNTDERNDDELTLSENYVQLVETLGPNTQDLYRIVQGNGPLGYTIGNRSRLDYVFGVSGDYEVLDSNIDDFVETYDQTLERLSDHLGAYAKIDIPAIKEKSLTDGNAAKQGASNSDDSSAATKGITYTTAIFALILLLPFNSAIH
jgi:endonuclease/exonuclease/phosphatase family metal-dependent hydrolase